MRDDDDVLLLARADIIPDPPRAVDIVVLVVALERARVLVPFRIPFALGPVEPLLRELGLGLLERTARVAGPAAAFLELGEDHDGDGVGAGCGGQDGREAEEHGLKGAAEGRDEDDGIGWVERGEEIGVASRDREALSHSALCVCRSVRGQPCVAFASVLHFNSYSRWSILDRASRDRVVAVVRHCGPLPVGWGKNVVERVSRLQLSDDDICCWSEGRSLRCPRFDTIRLRESVSGELSLCRARICIPSPSLGRPLRFRPDPKRFTRLGRRRPPLLPVFQAIRMPSSLNLRSYPRRACSQCERGGGEGGRQSAESADDVVASKQARKGAT